MKSLVMCNTTNSLPNVDDSMVFCLLLYHTMGAFWTKRSISVCKWHVTTLPAWFTSTKQLVVTRLPNGSSMSGSSSSWRSLHRDWTSLHYGKCWDHKGLVSLHQKILDHLGSHRVGVVALKTILDHLCLQDIQKYGTPLVDVLLLLVVLLSAGLIRKFLWKHWHSWVQWPIVTATNYA